MAKVLYLFQFGKQDLLIFNSKEVIVQCVKFLAIFMYRKLFQKCGKSVSNLYSVSLAVWERYIHIGILCSVSVFSFLCMWILYFIIYQSLVVRETHIIICVVWESHANLVSMCIVHSLHSVHKIIYIQVPMWEKYINIK